MDALSWSFMFKFLRKTFLWVALAPLAITWLGALSNQVVLYANHDTFPVSINPVKLQVFTGGQMVKDPVPHLEGGITITLPDGTVMMDPTHCVMTSKTHLNWLADVFDFHDEIESIGDLLINVGDWADGFAVYVWGALVISALLKKKEE
jgi:hypothetical protein